METRYPGDKYQDMAEKLLDATIFDRPTTRFLEAIIWTNVNLTREDEDKLIKLYEQEFGYGYES